MPKKKTTDKAQRGSLWRVHPLITGEQRDFLAQEHKRTGESHSLIIRKALDAYIIKVNKKKK